jgi:hypothetical protein
MIKDFYNNNRPIFIDDKLKMSVMKNVNSMPDSSAVSILKESSIGLLGLLPLSVKMANSSIKYEYNIGSCISLQNYLFEREADFDEVYEIFKNMADILINLKKKSSNILVMSNCILNSEYIFVNEKTKEIYYLYIPFKHNFEEINFGAYIHELVKNISFKDQQLADSLMPFLQDKKQFTAEEFKAFLDSLKNAPSKFEPEPLIPVSPPPAMPYLFSKDRTQKYLIDKPHYNIGKLESNDLIINIFGISRYAHACIITENGRYYIRDSSANGTLVNGTRIEKGLKYELDDNDEIILNGLTDDQKAYIEISYIFRLE